MKNQINVFGAISAVVVLGAGVAFSFINAKTAPNFRKIAIETISTPVDQDQIDHLKPLEEKDGRLIAIKDARVVLEDMSPSDGAPPYFSAFVSVQFQKKPELLKVLVEKIGRKWTISDISSAEFEVSKMALRPHDLTISNPA